MCISLHLFCSPLANDPLTNMPEGGSIAPLGLEVKSPPESNGDQNTASVKKQNSLNVTPKPSKTTHSPQRPVQPSALRLMMLSYNRAQKGNYCTASTNNHIFRSTQRNTHINHRCTTIIYKSNSKKLGTSCEC